MVVASGIDPAIRFVSAVGKRDRKVVTTGEDQAIDGLELRRRQVGRDDGQDDRDASGGHDGGDGAGGDGVGAVGPIAGRDRPGNRRDGDSGNGC